MLVADDPGFSMSRHQNIKILWHRVSRLWSFCFLRLSLSVDSNINKFIVKNVFVVVGLLLADNYSEQFGGVEGP